MILKSESIGESYIGGWSAFAERYELEEAEIPFLLPLTAMSYGDFNVAVEELERRGFPGIDFAVTSSRHGVLEPCDGIEFEENSLSDHSSNALGWIAYVGTW